MDRRVLLVDADPQGSLSQAFFGAEKVESLAPHETLAHVFNRDALAGHTSLIVPTGLDNVSIARSNQHLAVFNSPCPQTTGLCQFSLQTWLAQVADFDLVLIDCPPNLYQCSWNALLAADRVIIPIPPEDFGTQGLRPVWQAVENAKQLNPRLGLLGQLVTRSDKRLLIHRMYEHKLRQMYGTTVFRTVIPEASAFKVSLTCRLPVSYYAPQSKAAIAVTQLSQELLERLEPNWKEERIA